MNSFFKLSHIIIKNICRSKLRNFIMVLFIVAAVFFMNLSLASFRYGNELNEFARTSGLYDSFMFVGMPAKQVYFEYSGEKDLFVEANKYVADELEQLKAKEVIADFSRSCQIGASIGEDMNVEAEFFFMRSDLLEKLSMQVAEGKWFDSCFPDNQKEDLVPVVIGDNLKCIYQTGDIFEENTFDIKCIVIGVLRHGARFLDAGVGGSGTDLNHATQIADNLVIVAKEYVQGKSSFAIRLPEKNKAISEQMVLEKTADISDTFSFRYLTDQANKGNIYQMQMQTTLAVLALLICIAGTACGNLLSFVQGKKRQAVYFLCGMKPKMGVVCMALENLLKLYLPALAGLIVFFVYCRERDYYGLSAGVYNILLTGVIITVIFAISVVRPLSIAKAAAALNAIKF